MSAAPGGPAPRPRAGVVWLGCGLVFLATLVPVVVWASTRGANGPVLAAVAGSAVWALLVGLGLGRAGVPRGLGLVLAAAGIFGPLAILAVTALAALAALGSTARLGLLACALAVPVAAAAATALVWRSPEDRSAALTGSLAAGVGLLVTVGMVPVAGDAVGRAEINARWLDSLERSRLTPYVVELGGETMRLSSLTSRAGEVVAYGLTAGSYPDAVTVDVQPAADSSCFAGAGQGCEDVGEDARVRAYDDSAIVEVDLGDMVAHAFVEGDDLEGEVEEIVTGLSAEPATWREVVGTR